jgi:hypothetical protein
MQLMVYFSLSNYITETFLVGRMMSPGMKIVGRTRTANFWHLRKKVILVEVLRSVYMVAFLMYIY